MRPTTTTPGSSTARFPWRRTPSGLVRSRAATSSQWSSIGEVIRGCGHTHDPLPPFKDGRSWLRIRKGQPTQVAWAAARRRATPPRCNRRPGSGARGWCSCHDRALVVPLRNSVANGGLGPVEPLGIRDTCARVVPGVGDPRKVLFCGGRFATPIEAGEAHERGPVGAGVLRGAGDHDYGAVTLQGGRTGWRQREQLSGTSKR